MLKGIDISSYQAGIESFKNDVDFVICKATEGVDYVDKYCDSLYQRAKRDGKLLGVYHFARPDLGNTTEEEAKWFVKNIKGYLNEAILVLDWERGNLGDTSYAKRFLDTVYNLTGVKPLLYASSSVINTHDFTDIVNSNYGLWVAQYGRDNGGANEKPVVKNWNFYALWQYTSKGRIQGYEKDVDMNYFYGDKEAWLKYANSKKDKQESIENAKKSVDEIVKEVIAGIWGNGEDRANRLTSAGYNAKEIQDRVNKILNTEKTYVVVDGDNLTKIARKYGVSVGYLKKKNNISNPDLIYIGQVIKI